MHYRKSLRWIAGLVVAGGLIGAADASASPTTVCSLDT